MEDSYFDQFSARERVIIRKSLDSDISFYNKSYENKLRNEFSRTLNGINKSTEPNEDETTDEKNTMNNISDGNNLYHKKLNELSMKHSIQQKLFIQEAEQKLTKSNFSPDSLRSFLNKTNNFKRKSQEELNMIYQKFGSNRQIPIKKRRCQSERKNSDYISNLHRLNISQRLTMFSNQNSNQFCVQPALCQSQQIQRSLPIFETESEKVFNDYNQNDPFDLFLSHQDLSPPPDVKVNVKPPPVSDKKIASPRKKTKSKSSKLSKSDKNRNRSNVSFLSNEEQQNQPSPPIKKHNLTIRTSLIPKNGIIDLDKRDFLDFINDKEEEIVVEFSDDKKSETEVQENVSKSKSKKAKK